MKIISTNFIVIIMLCMSSMAMADDLDLATAYQVEIIAFHHRSQVEPTAQENFIHYPGIPDTSHAQTLLPYDDEQPLYTLLPDNKFRLKKEASQLLKSANYDILFHYAWMQTIGNSKPLHLSSSPNKTPENSNVLDGTIKVTKGLYYYLNIDLLFAPHYVLKQTRRIKKDEIHYIDHPRFGLLVQIHPIMHKPKKSYQAKDMADLQAFRVKQNTLQNKKT